MNQISWYYARLDKPNAARGSSGLDNWIYQASVHDEHFMEACIDDAHQMGGRLP